MKLFIQYIFLSLSISNCFSQSVQIQIPEILPPSPDVASLIKVGMGGVNFSTGAVNTSVALYEVKLGDLALPVSVSYMSQGTRVGEASTRVGIGWSLNAGGVISRNVLGRPDELAPRPEIPADIAAATTDNYNYFKNAGSSDPTSAFDTQPDEFRFSFNGYSGKFMLDGSGNPVIISHQNLSILFTKSGNDINNIIITTPDGVQYWFGGPQAFEKTITLNLNYKVGIKTSFFLYKVQLVSGEQINFSYTGIDTKANIGLSQTIVLGGESEGACPTPLNAVVSQTTNSQFVEYRTCYLTSISATNGQYISLLYESRADLSNDVRLKTLNAFNQDGDILKQYDFSYFKETNFEASSNGRFFLTGIKQIYPQPENEREVDLGYTFEYNDMEHSAPTIYSQDLYGFANGKTNGTSLPKINERPDLPYANKTSDWTYSAKGILSKIIYPTGGSEEFIYQPNTVSAMEKVNTIISNNFVDRGIGNNGYQTIAPVKYHFMHSDEWPPIPSQAIVIRVASSIDPAYIGTIDYPGDLTKVIYIKVFDITTGAYILNDFVYALNQISNEININSTHTYRVEMEVRGPSYIVGTVTYSYDYAVEPIYTPVNIEAGGVRLSQIKKWDPINNTFLSKYFIYASLENITSSSGRAFLSTSFKSSSMSPSFNETGYSLCHYNIYNSNSAFDLFKYDNSHIYYTAVIETDDLSFRNGATEHKFYDPVIGGGGWNIWGTGIPNLPSNTHTTFNGLTKSTVVFDKMLKPMSSVINNYEHAFAGPQVQAIAVRTNYDIYPTGSIMPNHFKRFNVTSYHQSPGWVRLESTISKVYDVNNKELVNQVNYLYGSPANVSVKTFTTANSKGEEIVHSMKYPTDFVGQPIYDLMISKNIVSPIVEESIFQHQVEMSKKITHYKDWFNNGKVIKPEIIQIKNTPQDNLHNQIFFEYNPSGNVTTVSKAHDFKTVYLWDYKNSLVVAEIKNASHEEVAYTSFESEAGTNFQLSNSTSVLEGLTGDKSYSGNLSTSMSQSGNYVVSLWSKTNNVTVNGQTSNSIKSIGLWKLFLWKLANVNSVSIAGNNMDEVRLYPEKALMTTYTHKPFVGITSECDVNNKITYYEYDGFNRLKNIRDQDRKIMKRYDYAYAPGSLKESITRVVSDFKQAYASNKNFKRAGHWEYVTNLGTLTNHSEFIKDGVLHLPERFNSVTPANVGLNYLLNEPYCVGNGYTVEARVKEPQNSNNVWGYDVAMWTLDEFYHYYVTLNNSPFLAGYGDLTGLHLGVNIPVANTFDEWRIIKYKVTLSKISVYFDGQLVTELPRNPSRAIGAFSAINFGFKGHDASVDWVKVYDQNDALKYFEDFTSPVDLAKVSADFICPSVNCTAEFTTYFNEAMGTTYTFGQIGALYLEQTGQALIVCD